MVAVMDNDGESGHGKHLLIAPQLLTPQKTTTGTQQMDSVDSVNSMDSEDWLDMGDWMDSVDLGD